MGNHSANLNKDLTMFWHPSYETVQELDAGQSATYPIFLASRHWLLGTLRFSQAARS